MSVTCRYRMMLASSRWHSFRDFAWVRTRSSARSVRAAWERCIAPGTRGSGAMSQSRSCRRRSPAMRIVGHDSNAKHRRWRCSRIPTSRHLRHRRPGRADLPGHGAARRGHAARAAERRALPVRKAVEVAVQIARGRGRRVRQGRLSRARRRASRPDRLVSVPARRRIDFEAKTWESQFIRCIPFPREPSLRNSSAVRVRSCSRSRRRGSWR